MIYLSKEQILLLHSSMIEKTGGLAGLRDESLLESAISAPLQPLMERICFCQTCRKLSDDRLG